MIDCNRRRISCAELPVGGFIKQSLNDYAGRVSAVVFTRGCNFRCVYCHNPDLVLPERHSRIPPLGLEDIEAWLSANRKLLDAVVITGGEPTIHASLPMWIRRIRTLGMEVKLDTNGTNPAMLERLIRDGLVDYIAMDLKTVPDREKYSSVCGSRIPGELIDDIQRSLSILQRSGISCEVRSTLIGSHHTADDVIAMADKAGRPVCLQQCDTSKTLRDVSEKGSEKKEIRKIAALAERNGVRVCLR